MKNGVRRAAKDDIPALVEIWKACFFDSEEYINYFYRENFDRIEVFVYVADGKPVCIVNILDAEFVYKNESRKAKYMYAGGTLPEYRKKGYFKKLMQFTFDRAIEEGHGLFFKPATKYMTDYTLALGPEIDSYFRLVTVEPDGREEFDAVDISHIEYNRMRNEAYSDIPFARWDDEHVRWCVNENSYFSGKTLKISLDGKEYFLMGYAENKTLILNETNLSLSQIKRISSSLCKTFGAERIKAYMPDFSCNEGERIVSSVIYNLQKRNTYVNLILI